MQAKNKGNLNILKIFSDNLRFSRNNAGLSREKFAEKIGLTGPTQISHYETGKNLPNARTLVKIAEVLSVDIHWLITGEQSLAAKMIIKRIRPYAIAHLSEITITLQRLERERQDLYARNAQGEQLKGAIKDVESLIESQHRYYAKAFQEIDEVLDIATHREKTGKAIKKEGEG